MKEIKKLTCIECPMGCDITVETNNNEVLSVSGNTCPRGALYAKNEITCPKRVLTTTVRCQNGALVAVKTSAPIEKAKVFKAMKKVNEIHPKTPIKIGEVLCQDICDGVSLIATDNCN